MFGAPKQRGNQKYDWYNMKRGDWFSIKVTDVGPNWQPTPPTKLIKEGAKFSTIQHESKETSGEWHYVVQRIE